LSKAEALSIATVIGASQSHTIKRDPSYSLLIAKIYITIEMSKMSRPKTKKPPPYLYDGPPPSDQEKADETEDIYDTKTRETMLQEDDISTAEDGFMMGREQEPPSKKETKKNAISHTDEVAVELAKEDAEDS